MTLRKKAHIKQFSNTERGTGSGEVLAYIIAFTTVWAVFYWVTDWIYNTKEEKVERRVSRAEEKYEKSQDHKYIVREPGGSSAVCWGIIEKQCKTVLGSVDRGI